MMTLLSIADAPEMMPLADLNVDVHARLAELRAIAPIARVQLGMVMALRHRHLELITSDATRQIETETKALQGITNGPIYDFIDSVMLFSNGEAHRRRRNPVSRTFAFKLMDAMRPKATAIAEELVGERLGAGPIDFVGEVAAQLPARIIAEILGIPRSDLPIFLQWIADTAEALGFINPERRGAIEASLIAFNGYVADLLAQRRTFPAGDFLSDYVETTARDGDMSETEIRSQVVGLILAGADTTRGALSMTLAQLLAHPDQWRAFCADPQALRRGVVDEGLRFEPVVGGVPRIAVRDLEVDGYFVPKDTPIGVSLVSVLRDPDVYADPESFDIHRRDHPRWHPIFGGGAHRCVGEALARAEMEEALSVIARLAPQTRLIGRFPRLAPGAIRQIDQMHVSFQA